jgi:alginate O-acetyltransferase complex protein AlgI
MNETPNARWQHKVDENKLSMVNDAAGTPPIPDRSRSLLAKGAAPRAAEALKMLFTQFEFIFLFVPVTLIGYFGISKIFSSPLAQVIWLAAASLIFYGYWDITFVPIIVASIVVNYLFGLAISAAPRGSATRRSLLLAILIINLTALSFFKYTNFGITTYNAVTGSTHTNLSIALPLGISFFTFTQIAYLVDVYGGYCDE